MKKSSLFLFTFFLSFSLVQLSTAQPGDAERITAEISQAEVEFYVSFLAADEFLGRDTGSQELDIASRFIAEYFRKHGVETADGFDSYFQDVSLQVLSSPESITFTVGDSTFQKNSDLILLTSASDEFDGPLVFLEYATQEELAEVDAEGKIVVANAGLPGQTSPQQFFMSANQKNQWVSEAGGIALVELYSNPQFPWQILVNFLGGERIDFDNSDDESDSDIPHFWMNANIENRIDYLEEMSSEHVSLSITGGEPKRFTSRNVVGVVRGTDPDLANEYLLLGAHYDHVGVVDGHPEPITTEYIYNGARDNAVGTAGILSAAKYFSKNPPKRSVIFAAWTAEEVGLLGSRYYSENPMIPLGQTIYNLNIDGAGYNDTTKVTVIGLGRTEGDDEIKSAADSFGLEAIPDPVPEQNLFDRSDNVNFARNGIPAPTYSMGLTAFDDEISYYYHQPADEPHTVNFPYITAYVRSFILAAQQIANRDSAPFWLPGDVYEEAGLELYGIEQ